MTKIHVQARIEFDKIEKIRAYLKQNDPLGRATRSDALEYAVESAVIRIEQEERFAAEDHSGDYPRNK